jgi:hypothetical protein
MAIVRSLTALTISWQQNLFTEKRESPFRIAQILAIPWAIVVHRNAHQRLDCMGRVNLLRKCDNASWQHRIQRPFEWKSIYANWSESFKWELICRTRNARLRHRRDKRDRITAVEQGPAQSVHIFQQIKSCIEKFIATTFAGPKRWDFWQVLKLLFNRLVNSTIDRAE